MKRSRYALPLTVSGLALLAFCGASAYDRFLPVLPTKMDAQAVRLGGIIDPHTGQRLGFDPRLEHGPSKPLPANGKVGLNRPMPSFAFADYAGKSHQMSDYKGQVTIFTFVFAACPCTRAYNDRMKQLESQYKAQGVNLVYLYADPSESLQTVQAFSQRQNYDWTLVRDGGQPLVKLFDAHCSTETYLVDRAGVLRYHGRIDDEIFSPESVKEASLELALKAVLANKPVAHPERPVFACSIPRKA